MVDLAAGVMTGGDLASMGYGTGLYQAPPYVTVKVPVFSFGKLSDANSYMGPALRARRDGGHRRGVREPGVACVSRGGEPDAHHQGGHGGDPVTTILNT